MRVLFMCHRFSDLKVGGMAEFLHYLPAALQKIGVDSIIYAQSENEKSNAISSVKLDNGIMCYQGPFIKPGWFVSNKKLDPFLALCKEQRIDLIHSQGIYRCGIMAMKATKRLKIPFIVTSHSDILGASSSRLNRRNVRVRCAKVLKRANGVTHLTPAMADAVYTIYNARDKSVIIGNGIDLPAWEKFANSAEKNYLLAIGRLAPEKGFDVLINAYAELVKHGQTLSLVIAGAGAEEKNLQSQAKNTGLNVVTHFSVGSDIPANSILFTGYVNGETKLRLFSECKIVLFSPQSLIWEEPFGIVQIEAMAAGKALIASETEATRFLEQQGLQAETVTAHDVTEWVYAITDLLKRDEERKRMGEVNRENSKQFDWPLIAKQYAEFYKKIIK